MCQTGSTSVLPSRIWFLLLLIRVSYSSCKRATIAAELEEEDDDDEVEEDEEDTCLEVGIGYETLVEGRV